MKGKIWIENPDFVIYHAALFLVRISQTYYPPTFQGQVWNNNLGCWVLEPNLTGRAKQQIFGGRLLFPLSHNDPIRIKLLRQGHQPLINEVSVHKNILHSTASVMSGFLPCIWKNLPKDVRMIIRGCGVCNLISPIPPIINFGRSKVLDRPFSRPFTFVSVDPLAPISVHTQRKAHTLTPIAFACQISRFLHVEFVEELNTATVSSAMRQFCSFFCCYVEEYFCDKGSVLADMNLTASSGKKIKVNQNLPYAHHRTYAETAIRTLKMTAERIRVGNSVSSNLLRVKLNIAASILNCIPLTGSTNLSLVSPADLVYPWRSKDWGLGNITMGDLSPMYNVRRLAEFAKRCLREVLQDFASTLTLRQAFRAAGNKSQRGRVPNGAAPIDEGSIVLVTPNNTLGIVKTLAGNDAAIQLKSGRTIDVAITRLYTIVHARSCPGCGVNREGTSKLASKCLLCGIKTHRLCMGDSEKKGRPFNSFLSLTPDLDSSMHLSEFSKRLASYLTGETTDMVDSHTYHISLGFTNLNCPAAAKDLRERIERCIEAIKDLLIAESSGFCVSIGKLGYFEDENGKLTVVAKLSEDMPTLFTLRQAIEDIMGAQLVTPESDWVAHITLLKNVENTKRNKAVINSFSAARRSVDAYGLPIHEEVGACKPIRLVELQYRLMKHKKDKCHDDDKKEVRVQDTDWFMAEFPECVRNSILRHQL